MLIRMTNARPSLHMVPLARREDGDFCRSLFFVDGCLIDQACLCIRDVWLRGASRHILLPTGLLFGEKALFRRECSLMEQAPVRSIVALQIRNPVKNCLYSEMALERAI
jgi:hypothetical protein